MEKLKSLIPESLKHMVVEEEDSSRRTPDVYTCSSLLNFFLNSQLFHQLIKDLAAQQTALCGKDNDSAFQNKLNGNQFYSKGDYSQALTCYSQALRAAPIDATDGNRNLVASLYLNRATSLHKMDLFIQSLRDSDRAIQISPNYSKAWYRRGKVNASLGNYQDAAHDLIIAQSMESSLSGKRSIQCELNIIKDQQKRTSKTPVQHDDKLGMPYEAPQAKLQCIIMPDKGRGMVSQSDIPQATLVHREEPYAMTVLKHCRDTYCHYCLNELPPDTVPCTTCSIAIYCSQHCQVQAGGQRSANHQKKHNTPENISHDLEKHFAKITLGSNVDPDVDQFSEHMHECEGVNWPAVLPTDIVLAARFLIKHIKQKGGSLEAINTLENLELSHSYSAMTSESKLEIHIYSIVLLCCLQYSHGYECSVNALSISQVIILISQIRVNSMAVVRIRSCDANGLAPYFNGGSVTSNMEQVSVGQAIYMSASLFNHSCQPNIHAYFLSRTLLIRTTEFVAANCSLELSYGPQVGQPDYEDCQKILQDKYYFKCNCHGCSEFNMSDLVVNAFHCVNQDCPGVVLDSCVVNFDTKKFDRFLHIPRKEQSIEAQMFSDIDVNEVASISFEKKNHSLNINPGCCLVCGSHSELDSLHVAVAKTWNCMTRLQDSIISKEISRTILANAVRSLSLLRPVLHAYNRKIAKAEDILAQAYCLLGDFLSAKDHCKESIKILEKLYDPNHIVIAHELVKLSSIQLSLGDCTVVDSVNRVRAIYSRYYGAEVEVIFPYLEILQEEADKIS